MKKALFILIALFFLIAGCAGFKDRFPATRGYVKKQIAKFATDENGFFTKQQVRDLIKEVLAQFPNDSQNAQAALILKLLEESEANKIRAFTETLGGGAGALDAIACANLAENDLALVFDVNSTTMLFYWFDDDAEDAEEATNYTVIRPDNYAACGDGVWKLLTSFLFAGASQPSVSLKDSDQAHQTIAKIYANANDANDSYVYLQVEIGTSLTTLITLDGVNEEILFGKKIDLSDLNIENVGDIALDSISADGATIVVGDTDEEIHIRADGLPDSDATYSCGMIVYLTAGNAVKQFDLVAMQTDGKVDMANASMNTVIGFAVEETNDGWPAADTETIGVCLLGSGGVIRNDAWAGHTAGEIVYVVDAGGTDGWFDPADEIDLEDGDHWIPVGVMQEEDIIIFPVPAWVTDDGA